MTYSHFVLDAAKPVSICFSLWGIFLLTSLMACVSATAQDVQNQAVPSAEDTVIEIPTVPVRVDGETLFRVRGVSAYPAEQRAQVIATRIRTVASDHDFNVQDLRVNDSSYSADIMAGRLLITSVFDSDARLEGVGRQNLASAYMLRVKEAIEDYRR